MESWTRRCPRWEHRYYKRVGRHAYTICWGLLLGIAAASWSVAPPITYAVGARDAQSSRDQPARPAPPGGASPSANKPASSPPFSAAWTLDSFGLIDDPELVVSETRVLVSGPKRPLEARLLTDGSRAWIASPALRQLALDGGRAFGLDDTTIHAVDETSGTVLWTGALDPDTQFLTAAAGHVLLAAAGSIRSLSAENGSERWRVALDAAPVTAVAVSPALLALALANREVIALDPSSGRVRWRSRMDDVPLSTQSTGSRVLVGLPRLAACALHESDGSIDWCTHLLRVPSIGRASVDDRYLHMALLDGTLRTLDRHTGTLLRTDVLDGRPAAGPTRLGTDLAVPLSSSEFVIVSSAGRISRVPPTAASQIMVRAGVATEARRLVRLSSTMRLDMTLSALQPAPTPEPAPAVQTAPATRTAPDPVPSPETRKP